MINKFIKILGLSIIVLGFLLSIASLMYNRYANENEFQEKLLALDEISSNNSEKYFKLREEEYLTPKFVLENYGITSIIVGSIILVIYLYASKALIINLLNNHFVSFYFLSDNNDFFLSK